MSNLQQCDLTDISQNSTRGISRLTVVTFMAKVSQSWVLPFRYALVTSQENSHLGNHDVRLMVVNNPSRKCSAPFFPKLYKFGVFV